MIGRRATPVALPAPPRRGRTAPIWLFALLVVLLVALVAYILTFLGAAASVVGVVSCMAPPAVSGPG